MEDAVSRLQQLCGGPRDGALLRVTLANALLVQGDASAATVQLRRALAFDPDYSTAWKLLGKALVDCNDATGAMNAYRAGIAAANRRGDKQAEKEMQVFLRRLEKSRGGPVAN